jgi:alpha-beta hydrolase superfamily lysophospholipase
MKRIIVFILTLFLLLINSSVNAAPQIVKKEIKAVAKDGFNINATLSYPRIKNQKEYSTVVLLHSLGYNSQWWGDLPKELLAKGYAVLTIDLRGHGESVYNKKLAKVSWKNLKNLAFSKYPNDIIAINDIYYESGTYKYRPIF